MSNKRIHKIVIDRDGCIGAATCIFEAPEAFKLDSENVAVLVDGAEKVDDDKLLIAAQSCPTQAIILYDKDGVQIFPQR